MDPIVAPPLVCAAWSDGTRAWLTSRAETVDAFREALRGEITNTHICFDLAVMAVAEPRLLPHIFEALEQNRVSSVDISEVLHDIGRSVTYANERGQRVTNSCLYRDPITGKAFKKKRYSQVLLEQRYLGIDRTAEKQNGWRLRYGELIHVPLADWPADALEYPKRDAGNALLIHLAQEGHNNKQARPEEMRAAWSRYLQRAWGVRADPSRVSDLKAAVTKIHEETVARFTACGIYRGEGQINPKSKTGRPYPPSQWGTRNTDLLKRLVTEAYKGSPPQTESGDVSTDRDTLLESGSDLLEDFAETGENEKLYSTYLEVLERGTRQPIHPEYILIVTGRPSSSSPNLYNLPRDHRIRECIVPRPGYLFSDADYAAIEFATLAQECFELFGYSAMRDALVANKDPHVLFAATLAGVPYEQMFARYKSGEKTADEYRQHLGKTWNYGKGGGMGPPTMVYNARKKGIRLCVVAGAAECTGQKITEYRGRTITPTCVDCIATAERADSAYFATWPEMEDYFRLVSGETANRNGTIQGYGFSRAGCGFTDGANFRFQHRASRGQNRALWRLARECYTDRNSPLFGSRPVVTPYDQALTEVPEAKAPEAADRQALIMREEMQAVCPDVPIKVEPVLTRRWLKGAKPSRDASGRLMVTEC